VSHDPSGAVAPVGEPVDGWPARIEGVIETVIATNGPNGRWNQAALGISPGDDRSRIEAGQATPATARTYGRTRTRRNLAAGRQAYVQFTRDPVDFVEAALSVFETDAPILASADAWTEVRAERTDRSEEHGTEVLSWSVAPIAAAVRQPTGVPAGDRSGSVPTINRGRSAAIEATVPASRLDVEGYDGGDLLQRLSWLEEVVEAAGDERARVAFRRIDEHVGWRDRIE
jgi:hypothetical protein